MAKKVSDVDVDEAREELLAAKKSKDAARVAEASDRLALLRSAWRAQEEEAGRRSPVETVDSSGTVS